MPFAEAPGRRPPAAVLRRDQARQRADGACLRATSTACRCTGLRFFTVYGPWGRPDMAPMLFASAILDGRADQALQRRPAQPRLHLCRRHRRGGDPRQPTASPRPTRTGTRPTPIPATSNAPFRIYNIGNSAPVELADFIAALEDGARAHGDPRAAAAAARRRARHLRRHRSRLARAVNWRPGTPVAEGVRRFAEWYQCFYPPGGETPR